MEVKLLIRQQVPEIAEVRIPPQFLVHVHGSGEQECKLLSRWYAALTPAVHSGYATQQLAAAIERHRGNACQPPVHVTQLTCCGF